MDIKEYFKEINNFIDRLTDNELVSLLVEAGIEKCPLEDSEIEDLTYFIEYPNTAVYQNERKYSFKNYNNNFNILYKVA